MAVTDVSIYGLSWAEIDFPHDLPIAAKKVAEFEWPDTGLASPVEAAVVLGDVRSEMTYALEAAARASHALSKPGLRASKDSNS